MKRLASIVTIAAILLPSTPTASAQEEAAPSNCEHLKGLECFVGNWAAEVTMPPDYKDPKLAGKHFNVRASFKWVLNQSALEASFRTKIPGLGPFQAKWLWYYDLSTKEIKDFSLNSAGAHGQGTWTKQEDKWIGKGTGVEPKGEKTSVQATFRMIDDDTHVQEFKDTGPDPEPVFKVEYKRVKPRDAKPKKAKQ